MRRFRIYSAIVAAGLYLAWPTMSFSQSSNVTTETKSVIYEELYDNPFDINKLFVHIQPIYGELFGTNTTGGFGLQAQYYVKNVFDVQGHVRLPYATATDLVKNAAKKNSTVDNVAKGYVFYELTGTYHVVDKDWDTETKFILFSKRYKGDKWAATVPLHTVIPTKVRRIYGARLGGFSYKSAVDYNAVMESQGVYITDGENNPIDMNESIYGNLLVYGVHIGGSMSLIKNVAVQPDKIYGTLVNDLIFTTWFDVLIAPSTQLDDIYLNGTRFASDPINKSMLGFRVGMEGKFNREVGWAYGAELGLRPGLQKSGFYILAKMSFPVFSTNLRHQVESFGK
jgi:hypothetical protein